MKSPLIIYNRCIVNKESTPTSWLMVMEGNFDFPRLAPNRLIQISLPALGYHESSVLVWSSPNNAWSTGNDLWWNAHPMFAVCDMPIMSSFRQQLHVVWLAYADFHDLASSTYHFLPARRMTTFDPSLLHKLLGLCKEWIFQLVPLPLQTIQFYSQSKFQKENRANLLQVIWQVNLLCKIKALVQMILMYEFLVL